MGRFVLVGVGDPDESGPSLDWAGAEAARRGMPLHLLHTQPRMMSGYLTEYALLRRELADVGERLLADAVAYVREVAPEVEVEALGDLDESPVDALVSAAADAELLVVGSRGRSAIGDLLAASATTGVVRRAPCPVVVVRPPEGGDTGRPDGPVVVGVDGSELSADAVELAFREASLWQTSVLALHAWQSPTAGASELAAYGMFEPGFLERAEQVHADLLSESLAGPREQHPDVEVVESLVQSHPGEALVDASDGARLVVTGTRGHGGFANLLLGSVSSAVLHHAHCPVMVTRRPSTD